MFLVLCFNEKKYNPLHIILSHGPNLRFTISKNVMKLAWQPVYNETEQFDTSDVLALVSAGLKYMSYEFYKGHQRNQIQRCDDKKITLSSFNYNSTHRYCCRRIQTPAQGSYCSRICSSRSGRVHLRWSSCNDHPATGKGQ